MRTYEYKVNINTLKEYTFFFEAESREEADLIIKTHTKRNQKGTFVATQRADYLASLQQRNHSEAGSRRHFVIPKHKDYTAVYECPECGHVWTRKVRASVAFKMCCPNNRYEHSSHNDTHKNVTYLHVYDRAPQDLESDNHNWLSQEAAK